jgi:hypothetical protein
MDKYLPQQEPNIRQPSSFLASLNILDSILNWLAGVIQLTEEEQNDAGIYLGDR